MAEEIKWKNTIDKSLYLLADMLDDKGAVGSIIITGVNKSPAQLYDLDGTWECIKKEFKPTHWKIGAAVGSDQISFSTSYSKNAGSEIYIAGDGISIKLYWTNVVAMNDGTAANDATTPLCNIIWNKVGINGSIPYPIYAPGQVDYLNAIPQVCLQTSGRIRIWDWTTQQTSYYSYTGQGHGCSMHIPHLAPEYMLDDFCQLWYWKRVS